MIIAKPYYIFVSKFFTWSRQNFEVKIMSGSSKLKMILDNYSSRGWRYLLQPVSPYVPYRRYVHICYSNYLSYIDIAGWKANWYRSKISFHIVSSPSIPSLSPTVHWSPSTDVMHSSGTSFCDEIWCKYRRTWCNWDPVGSGKRSLTLWEESFLKL